MTQSSKEKILEAVKAARVSPTDMPDLSVLEGRAITYDDPAGAFADALVAAGGAIMDSVPQDEPDCYVVSGAFAVAENGCVWIENGTFAQRKDLFIHERLVIRLDRTKIVSNMHQAYARLGEKASGYGIFISGPSKTADIEQALVLGAHGPRSLVVVFE